MKHSRAELKWRARQRPGAIMKPSTFQHIKLSGAHRKGIRNPAAYAGAAYWRVEHAKYLKRRKH